MKYCEITCHFNVSRVYFFQIKLMANIGELSEKSPRDFFFSVTQRHDTKGIFTEFGFGRMD